MLASSRWPQRNRSLNESVHACAASCAASGAALAAKLACAAHVRPSARGIRVHTQRARPRTRQRVRGIRERHTSARQSVGTAYAPHTPPAPSAAPQRAGGRARSARARRGARARGRIAIARRRGGQQRHASAGVPGRASDALACVYCKARSQRAARAPGAAWARHARAAGTISVVPPSGGSCCAGFRTHARARGASSPHAPTSLRDARHCAPPLRRVRRRCHCGAPRGQGAQSRARSLLVRPPCATA